MLRNLENFNHSQNIATVDAHVEVYRISMHGKRTIQIITLLFAFTMTTAAKGEMKPWDNGKLMVSENQKFFQHEKGTPFFWLGDTGWLLPERADRDEAAYYLQECRKAGFNVVQVQVINGVPAYNAYAQ